MMYRIEFLHAIDLVLKYLDWVEDVDSRGMRMRMPGLELLIVVGCREG